MQNVGLCLLYKLKDQDLSIVFSEKSYILRLDVRLHELGPY
jgi:hypothetical protein